MEALKRAYAAKVLDMRAKVETEDLISFVAITAAAALLSDVGDMWVGVLQAHRHVCTEYRAFSF